MKIHRIGDLIPVKVHDIQIKITPLTIDQKNEIQPYFMKAVNGDTIAATKGSMLAIKYGLKALEGASDSAEDVYELEFDENKELTDQCVDDLFNCEYCAELISICSTLLGGIPKNGFVNPETGEALEGVKIISPKKPKAPRKKK